MERICFLGQSPALQYAKAYALGCGFAAADDPAQSDTILLDVPTRQIPEGVSKTSARIYGGSLPQGFGVDLLRDPWYLEANAAITAHCALQLAFEKLSCILPEAPVLILGWGRIARHLARLCHSLGAAVTIWARKETNRAEAAAMGLYTCSFSQLESRLGHFRLIFNTIPAPILNVRLCREDCVKIDLASVQGLSGDGILWARGLPGKMAPESSGKLIIQSMIRLEEAEK